MNIVMAINMGADDFVAKPFDIDMLLAKIQALLRRTYDFTAAAPPDFQHNGVSFQQRRRQRLVRRSNAGAFQK